MVGLYGSMAQDSYRYSLEYFQLLIVFFMETKGNSVYYAKSA